MKHLSTTLHAAIGLTAGILMGTWLLMLCFGPFGFVMFIPEHIDPATLTRLDAWPRKPLALAMLALGVLLARWTWRHAPAWRWLVVTAALVPGVPGTLWTVVVFALAGTVPGVG
jgi:hypothetical protein